MSGDNLLQQMADSIVSLDAERTKKTVGEAINSGIDPHEIIKHLATRALCEIGGYPPVENVRAIIDATRTYGRYPISI